MRKETIGNCELYLGDCMEYMKDCNDNAYDLAIVDPPYGIDAGNQSDKSKHVLQDNGSTIFQPGGKHEKKDWDKKPPDPEYFRELMRTSKHQIIFGVNYYKYDFGGVGRIIWDKVNDHTDQNDCEIAYCSFNDRIDIVRYMWAGFMQGAQVSKDSKTALLQQGNKQLNEKRIHPTQKPVKLYEWLLINYAEPNQKILDTHGGSMSIALACHNLGFELTLLEIDKDYFDGGVERVKQHVKQLRMF